MINEYLLQASIAERLAVLLLFIFFVIVPTYRLIKYFQVPRSFKLIWNDIRESVRERKEE